MDKNTFKNNSENALKLVYEESKDVLKRRKDELKFGWLDVSIGDTVYFVGSCDEILEILKGIVIGIKKYDRRMWNDPTKDNMGGYKISTVVTLVIETPNGIVEMDSKLVYTDKLDALLASISNIIGCYFKK